MTASAQRYPHAPRMIPAHSVPILINSFNRLSCLQRLVGWLIGAGQRRIIIMDNASTYPPLLAWLREIEASGHASVIRLGENYGHRALWEADLLGRLGIDSEFVYTDPDVVPAPDCPPDLVARLQALLRDEPLVTRAGLGLRLDCIPDCFAHKQQALAWERRFWARPAAPGWFVADIDTTFALYRPGAPYGAGQLAVRSAWPYVASHEGWSVDSAAPGAEDLFYMQTARRGSSAWSLPELTPKLSGACHPDRLPQPRLVHIRGEAAWPVQAQWPGYASHAPGRLDIATGTVDGIYVHEAFATFCNDALAWSELRRVARPDAMLVLRVPSACLADLQGRRSAPPWRRIFRRRVRPIPESWHLERVVMLGSPANEAALHMRACSGDTAARPAAPMTETLAGSLDLTLDFTLCAPCPA